MEREKKSGTTSDFKASLFPRAWENVLTFRATCRCDGRECGRTAVLKRFEVHRGKKRALVKHERKTRARRDAFATVDSCGIQNPPCIMTCTCRRVDAHGVVLPRTNACAHACSVQLTHEDTRVHAVHTHPRNSPRADLCATCVREKVRTGCSPFAQSCVRSRIAHIYRMYVWYVRIFACVYECVWMWVLSTLTR